MNETEVKDLAKYLAKTYGSKFSWDEITSYPKEIATLLEAPMNEIALDNFSKWNITKTLEKDSETKTRGELDKTDQEVLKYFESVIQDGRFINNPIGIDGDFILPKGPTPENPTGVDPKIVDYIPVDDEPVVPEKPWTIKPDVIDPITVAKNIGFDLSSDAAERIKEIGGTFDMEKVLPDSDPKAALGILVVGIIIVVAFGPKRSFEGSPVADFSGMNKL